MEQRYKSACTSVNAGCKIPRIAKVIARPYRVRPRPIMVLDYGGGRYDTATEYLKQFNIINYIYDPFNRSTEENEKALSKTDYHMAVCSNVLNVIMEPEVRQEVLQNCWNHLMNYGVLCITVYEGDKSGVLKTNDKRNSCQLNRKLADYLPEVCKVFGSGNVFRRTNYGVSYIVAIKQEEK